jgi:hypothetical protein
MTTYCDIYTYKLSGQDIMYGESILND